MTKLELAIKIIEIREQKFEVVKSQRFEDAAFLRDLEKKAVREYEETYGYGSISSYTENEFRDFIQLLKAESRDQQIDDILNEDEIK